MKQNSKQFDRGLGLLNSKEYNQAINYFLEDLKIDPNNYASYNNIGLAQTYLGIKNKDKNILDLAIKNYQTAIEITKKLEDKVGFPSAEGNLKWAKDELSKL
uniref:hypothetical protein n=1 Tax=Flavobacterium sp. TaxID=239 RepID=UPI00404AFE67